MSSVIMRFWLKRRGKLIRNILLVGYLLLPNPTIMAHVNENWSEIHQQAVFSLIKRLILPPLLVRADRTGCLVELVNLFWDKIACFTTKKKKFCFPYMWESEMLFVPIAGISTIQSTQQRF